MIDKLILLIEGNYFQFKVCFSLHSISWWEVLLCFWDICTLHG